ncbi:cryptochrome/photolyase family protein [Fulvimarina sp. 2208YS6-2-32]|uniref:Cryptochrome/photolyase family protein n=1 Tax=Fulvimarina uroteuthidis TaxID=3098149 RepID=A0ABU5HXT5_9HYPH|nr:cryptochrome/photolyase family protein [Fulvimarina sp. 2208YS6-2-32]MDY8107583.1 cryptochrome/photolyase family protein [Fulvimarina sp. 2208YS6-2-32]
MACLRLVLGDQLSRELSALRDLAEGDIVFMCEVADEANYVRHHQRKIAFLFSAMRHFAGDLRGRGVTVDYVTLDDEANTGSFTDELKRAVARHGPTSVVVTEPGEWRVLQMMKDWRETLDVEVEIRPDDRFLCDHGTFDAWAEGRKELRMEYFYREMRRRTGFLMEGDEPVEGKWNFDHQNREPLKARITPPERPTYAVDATTRDVLDLVRSRFGNHFGTLDDFDYPVTRRQALHYLRWFLNEAMPEFGTYQDAMRQGSPLLFHSHISALINCGLLDPREVCDRAEDVYREGNAPINAVEGFIRQIIGWREFIRGVYWREMPDYAASNALDARRKLPDFFWTGDTELNCLRQSIAEVRASAYNHHIQRLMVIGNFCLLAGFDPAEVQEWYLTVYHDAYEWVEMPNVVGMILYADGGLFASKPYAASANYIDKMSDYCGHCVYSPKTKTGEGACPFNLLYWDFIARNRARLKGNPRLNRTYATLDRMNEDKVATARREARAFLDGLVATGDY